jgi:hypothetical protein
MQGPMLNAAFVVLTIQFDVSITDIALNDEYEGILC